MAQTRALMQFVHRRRRGAELFLLVLALSSASAPTPPSGWA